MVRIHSRPQGVDNRCCQSSAGPVVAELPGPGVESAAEADAVLPKGTRSENLLNASTLLVAAVTRRVPITHPCSSADIRMDLATTQSPEELNAFI
jgi:hypothetical protein